jgi:hypothetical protein
MKLRGMNLQRFIVRCAGAAVLAGACALAPAHNFHAGITDISYNERTGSLEVVHTYMAHDVEALLTNLYQRQFDLSDPDDQTVFRKYVEKQFWLADKDKRRLPLNWVGMTADAQSVMVYQEVVQTPAAKVEIIHDAVMSDFLPDQLNTVNLTVAGSLRTFGFSSSRTEFSVH